MQKSFICLFLCYIINIHFSFSQKVFLLYDESLPQAEYAARMVKTALLEQEYLILDERTGYDYLISIGVNSANLNNEAYTIIPEGKIITIHGGDNRGMIYGSLNLAESLGNGLSLKNIKQNSKKTPPCASCY